MSTETKAMSHTPGPWESSPQPGQRTFIVAGDEAIAEVFMCPFHENDKANTHLIAAAPELLEALEKAVNVATEAYSALRNYLDHAPDCDYHRTDSPHGDVCICHMQQRILQIRALIASTKEQAEAAIRKAKGEL